LPRRGQLEHAMIAAVAHVDLADDNHGHVRGIAELAATSALAAPVGQRLSRRRELLDAVAKRIGHVDVAFAIDRYTAGTIELPPAGAAGAPRADRHPVRR